MTESSPLSFWTLGRSSAVVFAVAAVWAFGSYVDLHDGFTWTKRSRYESGPLFHPVEFRTDPSTFKMIVALRGVMPVVLIGTIGMVLGLAAVGQRMNSRA